MFLEIYEMIEGKSLLRGRSTFYEVHSDNLLLSLRCPTNAEIMTSLPRSAIRLISHRIALHLSLLSSLYVYKKKKETT